MIIRLPGGFGDLVGRELIDRLGDVRQELSAGVHLLDARVNHRVEQALDEVPDEPLESRPNQAPCLRCAPEWMPKVVWSDFNVSDSGVIVVQMFARLGERKMYRMSQVPELPGALKKNKVRRRREAARAPRAQRRVWQWAMVGRNTDAG